MTVYKTYLVTNLTYGSIGQCVIGIIALIIQYLFGRVYIVYVLLLAD